MRIEFEMITSMCVQSSVLIGEVFQIEVSDGHVNLHPASVFTGARVLTSLYVFRI